MRLSEDIIDASEMCRNPVHILEECSPLQRALLELLSHCVDFSIVALVQ